MKKVFVVTRAAGREAALGALRDLGVLHLEPIDPKAAAPEQLRTALERVRRARQVIALVTPAGAAPDLGPAVAAGEILQIARRTEQNRNQLNALALEAGRLKVWGRLQREQLRALAEGGVEVKFYSVPAREFEHVRAECVARLTELPGRRVLVGLVQREGEPAVPESAEAVEPPQRDLPSVQARAKAVDQALADDANRLSVLANLGGALETEENRLASEAQFAAALAGAMRGEDLFAVQGWAPVQAAQTLAADLARTGIAAGVDHRDPTDEDQPPTLIAYPRWARPIKGLFDILGTSPGYREFDVSGAFMIALPIFAAMLIADGGYGLLFLVPVLLLYRRIAAKAGPALAQLVIVIGLVSVIWGVVTASFFGVGPEEMSQAGGVFRPVGQMLLRLRLVRVDTSSDSQNALMSLCFVLGAVHLSIAHLWRSAAFFPNLRFLCNLGWAGFLWGMLGLVRHFVLGKPFGWSLPYPYLLIVGGVLALVFARPQRNPIKMLGLGLASFPLSALSTFSDIISYVRLAAVGLASSVLAASFNELAFSAGLWPATVLILVLGHGLNLGLCVIALFAHGVRLNMLEFSTNLGVEWGGRAYQPFRKQTLQET